MPTSSAGRLKLLNCLYLMLAVCHCYGETISVGKEPLDMSNQGSSGSTTGGSHGNPENPFHVPDYYPDYTKGPYGFCGGPNDDQFCPSGSFAFHGTLRRDCVCQIECKRDSDCPDPGSGSSRPQCSSKGCYLPCESTSECPEGMLCGSADQFYPGKMCHWSLDHEDQAPPADCSVFTDPQSCQEYIETNVFRPELGCIWVKESILETGGDSCDPPIYSEQCVQGSRREHCDTEAENILTCGEGETWAHWQDLGAGTVALRETDTCYVTGGWGGGPGNEPCAAGDPPLPLICECACQGD